MKMKPFRKEDWYGFAGCTRPAFMSKDDFTFVTRNGFRDDKALLICDPTGIAVMFGQEGTMVLENHNIFQNMLICRGMGAKMTEKTLEKAGFKML